MVGEGGEWFTTSLASWSGVGGWGLDEVPGLGEFQVVRCLANREGWGLEVMGEDRLPPWLLSPQGQVFYQCIVVVVQCSMVLS